MILSLHYLRRESKAPEGISRNSHTSTWEHMASKIMISYLLKVGLILGVNVNIDACSAMP